MTELQTRLSHFEITYRMLSADFYTQFQAGALGDEADFFEWSALYDMYQSVKDRLAELGENNDSLKKLKI